jgi:hypothetical protein
VPGPTAWDRYCCGSRRFSNAPSLDPNSSGAAASM